MGLRLSRKPRSSAKRWYRKRVGRSMCKGRKTKTCRKLRGCRYVSGRTRKYCRKIRNTKRSSRINRPRRRKTYKGGNLNNKVRALSPASI